MAKNELSNREHHRMQPYKFDAADPKFQRKARREASTQEDNLDKRRMAYQHEGMELRAIIAHMQEIRAESLKIGDGIREIEKKISGPGDLSGVEGSKATSALALLREKLRLKEELYQDCYNIASLKGLTLLFEGQSLMVDMLSVERWEMNRETDTREYWRVSAADLLGDTSDALDVLIGKMTKITRMVDEIGVKHGIWNVGKHIKIKDGVEVDDSDEGEPEAGAVDLEHPAPAGVPKEDLEKISREKVVQLVRGEEPKKE